MASTRTETSQPGARVRHRPTWREFALPASRESVAAARRLTRRQLTGWGADDESRETAALVLSELFTNAVLHTDSELIVWEVRKEWGGAGEEVYLEVTGHRPGHARATHHRLPEEEHGRGLLLVDAVSTAWGIRDGHDDGWSVWARLPLVVAGGACATTASGVTALPASPAVPALRARHGVPARGVPARGVPARGVPARGVPTARVAPAAKGD
ncbi:ATP-binding protein [Streptomyces sp. 4N509B]|uniref:ATP-binding protein n=1 Tax=Streptomyces sp. 4N509B TaxID=3457413 RepID=UPI003FD23093